MEVFCEDVPTISHTPVNKCVFVCVFFFSFKLVQCKPQNDQIENGPAEASELILIDCTNSMNVDGRFKNKQTTTLKHISLSRLSERMS